jgi:hypothetical protein
MEIEYIDTIDALKLWLGDDFTDEDIKFYEFMKKNNCPEIFVEYNKNNEGGLMGNHESVNLKKNVVKKDYLDKIINLYKNAKIKRKVKGIIIINGKKQNKFGICNKDFPDLILPTDDQEKHMMVYTL